MLLFPNLFTNGYKIEVESEFREFPLHYILIFLFLKVIFFFLIKKRKTTNLGIN